MRKINWTEVVCIVIFILSILFFTFLGYLVFNYDTMNIFEYFSYILIWAILIIFVFITIYSIYRKRKMKGNNPFQKYESVNEIDLFNVEQLSGYKKIIKNENGLILINEAGIFEIRIIYGKGKLTGSVDEPNFKLNNTEIKNPFILKDSIKYLVLTKNLLIQVTGIRLVTKSRLIFVLQNYLNNLKYTKEDIDLMYDEVKHGYHEN